MNYHIDIENLKIEHFKQLLETMRAAYKNWQGSFWSASSIEKLIAKFPEGQIVVLADQKVVGCALSIVVKYDDYGDDHTYQEITSNFTFSSHDNKGDVLYGIEIFIHPDFRGLRLGRRLYDARKALCEKLNLRAVIFGGRIPNFHLHADQMGPKEYILKVKHREIYDPVLTFQLSNDFHVKKVLSNYMPDDEQSHEYATLLQWDNVYYRPEFKVKNRIRKNVRIGLVQWKMRLYQGIDELFQQAEYFVDSISNYKADFAVFPEYFNGPLMAEFDDMPESDAMRAVAQYTQAIADKFSELAIRYNVNIIAGSMPVYEDGVLKNAGYLCHRDGTVEKYEKLHVTPDEEKFWGLKGGDLLKTYDTDAGKIGILICYDVEFPELSRLLADDGMQILFVPYLTDTHNAYMRVKLCAQARAIENECFVAITGSVGNLPKIENFDIQYSQSAVFTPSDFAFPSNAIKSEATANTEMVLIADVDLKLLDQLHAYGSVRNLKDRRTDFYELKQLKK
ncbi:MAG TPA: bifunctional GNAT family N-acetyltransferase/carbon-nitrogen hydrolase family protein [Mucilaginibacter sp.]|nr:bifunctional GNAT family N-acetyltransferase/carbon-nitrogen hydrolase family protein [Mucilaginibacter sp.]